MTRDKPEARLGGWWYKRRSEAVAKASKLSRSSGGLGRRKGEYMGSASRLG